MGKQEVKENVVEAQQTTTSLTPSSVTGGIPVNQLGYLPIGVYKGAAAFFDLDKLVNQPLTQAEQQHILGILDGRTANYDTVSLTVTAAEAAATAHTGTLTVPTGDVWYINAVEMVLPASGGANTVSGNWQCSIWPLTGVTSGQAFHAAAVNFGAGGGTQQDEFGPLQLLFAITNKQPILRLPAGTIITFTATNNGVVAAATVIATLNLYGFRGKALVA